MSKPKQDLAAQHPLAIHLNIDPRRDSYIIKGGAGIAVAHVKKPSGEVFSAHVRADGAFHQVTRFDPSRLTVDERRRLEFDLHEKGHTQSDIADLVGVKQPTVAHDLKLMRQSSPVAGGRPTQKRHDN
ncbi:MAG: helix-turn-helix domain-containing protein [Betaproteobacteria bacterium]|nr:helix-turn-helix domain-containing protein [Betaproteobacteria bacterium]